MSSLLLGDPTKNYFKLTLWREASSWIERILPGDILFLTGNSEGNTVADVIMVTYMSVDG